VIILGHDHVGERRAIRSRFKFGPILGLGLRRLDGATGVNIRYFDLNRFVDLAAGKPIQPELGREAT